MFFEEQTIHLSIVWNVFLNASHSWEASVSRDQLLLKDGSCSININGQLIHMRAAAKWSNKWVFQVETPHELSWNNQTLVQKKH